VPYTAPDIKLFIYQQVWQAQEDVILQGYSLGYELEPAEYVIPFEYTQSLMANIAQLVINALNEGFNDSAFSRKWLMMNGKTVHARFIYVIAWKMWKDLAVEREEIKAAAVWEEIFGDAIECAKKAIIARVSKRMSSVARAQGKIWAKRHPAECEIAQSILASEFAELYPTQTGEKALEISEDNSPSIAPELKSQCLCWMRQNPEEVNIARETMNLSLATQFSEEFKDNSSSMAYSIINGLCDEKYLAWVDQAHQWRAYNSEAYLATEKEEIDKLAAQFAKEYPSKTNMEAAKLLDNYEICKYITEESVLKEFGVSEMDRLNATCWGTRNQGLLRAAREVLYVEKASVANRQWNEFADQSGNFTKGSYLYLSEEAKSNSSLDRFFGFRARLKSKFAWLSGYLLKRKAEVMKQLSDLDLIDPLYHVEHNIRPSEAERHRRETDRKFVTVKKAAELTLADILSKLSTWNTYFGIVEVEKVNSNED
jgi:hypothetical protein